MTTETSQSGSREPAPAFPGDLDWVNQRSALRLGELRGRIVLLHFWCASCINSANLITELKGVQARHHDAVTLVGVHCPRLDLERDGPAVLKAVNRLYIRYPVANDPDFQVWRDYGIGAWPSVVVIDMQGNVAGSFVGEGKGREIEELVESLVEDADMLVDRVYELNLPSTRDEPRVPLRFPAKVLGTEKFIYVSDTAHNRILEVTHEGRIVRQFGSGNPGLWDGKTTEAGFNHPTGFALFKDMLYIADMGNHALRRIRLISGDVETLAGTGVAALELPTALLRPKETALNSPRDLAMHGDRLYIAMAGMNQIWEYHLGQDKLSVLAGSGACLLRDGDFDFACMATPCGITAGPDGVYVVEGNSSSLRRLDLVNRKVETLIGQDLYEFGDVDGHRRVARMQYPCGVCFDSSSDNLWIADSYNGKLKMYNLRQKELRTLNFGYRFHEPTGISLGAGALWVANTAAHEIVRVDLAMGSVGRLTIGE